MAGGGGCCDDCDEGVVGRAAREGVADWGTALTASGEETLTFVGEAARGLGTERGVAGATGDSDRAEKLLVLLCCCEGSGPFG